MRISFIWDWMNDPIQLMTWKDGLSAAMRELSKKHQVMMFTIGKNAGIYDHEYFPFFMSQGGESLKGVVKAFQPDVILHFADCTRPHASIGQELGIPQALCFAGGNPLGETAKYFDHFFVESDCYKGVFERAGLSVSTAFGTNTDLFDPDSERLKRQSKVFTWCNLSTFATWKNHKLLADAMEGLSGVCAGFMYPDHEQECWQIPQDRGVLVLPHQSAEACAHLLKASSLAILPSRNDGGSQRSVLEAMAMNVPVIVNKESEKTSEYLRGVGWTSLVVDPTKESIRYWADQVLTGNIKPRGGREYILANWSHVQYADKIEQGLLGLL